MARKPTAKKATAKPDNELARRVAKYCAQGDVTKAARAVADANPPEAEFDALMASDGRLRDAFLRL